MFLVPCKTLRQICLLESLFSPSCYCFCKLGRDLINIIHSIYFLSLVCCIYFLCSMNPIPSSRREFREKLLHNIPHLPLAFPFLLPLLLQCSSLSLGERNIDVCYFPPTIAKHWVTMPQKQSLIIKSLTG